MTVVQTFERMGHQRMTKEMMLVLAMVLGGWGFQCGADLPKRRPGRRRRIRGGKVSSVFAGASRASESPAWLKADGQKCLCPAIRSPHSSGN